MPLIKCSECYKKISDMAAACPNCGNPNIGKNKADTSKIEKDKNRKKRICPECQNIHGDFDIECSKCGNPEIFLIPETGEYRRAKDWEKKVHLEKIANERRKESNRELSERISQLMNPTNLILAGIASMMIIGFWWFTSPYQQCLRDNFKIACDIGREIRKEFR